MAKRVSRLIAFLPSAAPDLAAAVIYAGLARNEDGSDRAVTYDDPHIEVPVPLPPPVDIDGVQKHVIALSEHEVFQNLPEGEYDIGVAWKDRVGNISDITEAEDVSLDITPPAAPEGVTVITQSP